tara:strand:+ start:736 stop:990 length:255 start_codon:yes stop_codon:yes gene_type:complete
MINISSLLFENALNKSKLGFNAIDDGLCEINFTELKFFDSSAVSVLIGWKKYAENKGITLRYLNLPAGILILAELYGVKSLIEN